MNDGFREARQNRPRKMEARDHGPPCFAPELVVSGTQSGIENERRQPDHAHAHIAQTRSRLGDEGNARPSTNELRVDGERAERVSGPRRGARTDREAMEKEINIFLVIYF